MRQSCMNPRSSCHTCSLECRLLSWFLGCHSIRAALPRLSCLLSFIRLVTCSFRKFDRLNRCYLIASSRPGSNSLLEYRKIYLGTLWNKGLPSMMNQFWGSCCWNLGFSTIDWGSCRCFNKPPAILTSSSQSDQNAPKANHNTILTSQWLQHSCLLWLYARPWINISNIFHGVQFKPSRALLWSLLCRSCWLSGSQLFPFGICVRVQLNSRRI